MKTKKDWAHISAMRFWFAGEKSGPWNQLDEPTQNTVRHIARILRGAYKRGYDQGVIAMATKINQATGKDGPK